MKRKVLSTAVALAAIFQAGCTTSKDSIIAVEQAAPQDAPRRKAGKQALAARQTPAKADRPGVPAAAVEAMAVPVPSFPAEAPAFPEAAEAGRAVPAKHEGVFPLSLASRDWPAADGPFREAANAARRHLADGDPEAAARAAGNAMKSSGTFEEKAEAKSLAAAADVLAGRAGPSVTAGLDRPSDDWKAIETARSGLLGPLPEARVREAFSEVKGWPSTAAARLLPGLASGASRSPALSSEILTHAQRLAASGLVGEAELAMVRGYAAKASGDTEAAARAFADASSSPLRAVAARAAVEAAEAGEGSMADRAAGMRTGDETERRALRMVVAAKGHGWREAAARLAEIAADPKEKAAMLAAVRAPEAKAEEGRAAASPNPSPKGDEDLLAEKSVAKPAKPSAVEAAEAAIGKVDRLIESFPSRIQ